MHTLKSTGAVLTWNLSAFLLRSAQVKSWLVYIIFWMSTRILMVIPPIYTFHVDTSPTGRPTMQFMQYFHWRTFSILFTLGNRCTSCYTTHATYVACQRDFPVNIKHIDSPHKHTHICTHAHIYIYIYYNYDYYYYYHYYYYFIPCEFCTLT